MYDYFICSRVELAAEEKTEVEDEAVVNIGISVSETLDE
jgi:hypothetical protein